MYGLSPLQWSFSVRRAHANFELISDLFPYLSSLQTIAFKLSILFSNLVVTIVHGRNPLNEDQFPVDQ